MTEPVPDKPPRRPRYQGKNPRHFQEKYKEHQPEKHADVVAKVLASGKTPAGTHRPIMVHEILEILAPQAGMTAADCTLGFGGHATELVASLQPGGKLIAVDADPIELPKTETRLRSLGYPPESMVFRRMNFAGIRSFILQESPGGVDMLLADLGLSSMQIDDPSRGFTFKADGPLDMRLNPGHGQSASELLSRLSEAELAEILDQNADEPQAAKLAEVLSQTHEKKPLTTTGELANVITAFMQKGGRATEERTKDTIRRVFQALRIAVNDEFGALDSFLRQLPDCLKSGGRVAILTFHSGEDRRVKQSFKRGLASGVYASISDDVIRASAIERHANPRSTSAKLRYAVRR